MALLVIVLATNVLPPVGTRWLNSSRIAQTRNRAEWTAERVRARLSDARLAGAVDVDIACGPGRLPDAVPAAAASRPEFRLTHESWLLGAVSAPELFGEGMPTDASGRCFLMNTGAQARGERLWIVSAGPNGLIETPVVGMTILGLTLGGDDIGAVVK